MAQEHNLCNAGQYQILYQIQRGTQARIYLARKANSFFCLKMYINSSKNHTCFENQCRILSSVEQKNVISLIEICREIRCEYSKGEVQKNSFMVMRYCECGDLKNLLEKVPFPVNIARTLMRNILGALLYLSSKQIIHCDIKPQNIGITSQFEIRLIDFGFSMQGKYRRKQLIGTLPFIAPQIFSHREYSQKSDIFSLGVIYFMMITGFYPFGSSKITDKFYGLIMQKRYKNFWQITQKKCKCKIPETVRQVIEAMLEWKPEKRATIEQIINFQQFKQQTACQVELSQFFSEIYPKKLEEKISNKFHQCSTY